MSNSTNNNVQSVERALNLLQIIAEGTAPIPISAITDYSGLNRTTVWRLLTTLEDFGFIERDPISKGYQLGYSATKLCPDIQTQYMPLIRIALPYIKKFSASLNEDILLTVPRFQGMLTIYQQRSDNAVLIRDYSMQISAFHSSSNGKLYLSYLEEDELQLILDQPLPQYTQNTITDPELLREEIRKARHNGYGLSLQENGIGENGLSVPIVENDRPIAFLNISGPSFRFTEDRIHEILPEAFMVASQISARFSR